MHLATTKVFIDDLGSMSLRVDDQVPEILRLLGFR
jgi:hypothetical protein